MGLNEKRKIKEYQDTIVPERSKELAEIVGGPIPYEVEWDTFADDLEALTFLDNLSFHRINMAMRTICTDDLGRQAVRDAVKRIRLRNVKDKAAMKIAFDNGTLEMHSAYALRTDGMFSDTVIRDTLLPKL